MVTNELKQKVVDGIKVMRTQFDSDAKHAVSLGVNGAVYSRVIKGEMDKVLSDAAWINLARQLQVSLRDELVWVTAETPVYTFITTQLKKCKKNSVSVLLCDNADIGKTYTAKQFAKSTKYCVYIDCSQVKTKQKLVRKIAKEFGVGHTGKYSEVYEDLVWYLNSIAHMNPIVILDEAGDLAYDAFLELKALWNATERCCGWFMMGADGLKEKITRAIDCKKVGYTEIFSRYGKRYQRVTPDGIEAQNEFTIQQAALVIMANAPKGTDVQKMLKATDGSLRRIYNEISKLA